MGAVDNSFKNFENADIDDSPFTEEMIVETTEPVENFTKSTPIQEVNGVKFYRRNDFQIRKGLERGDLFVADFGDFRLVAFTGGGVLF